MIPSPENGALMLKFFCTALLFRILNSAIRTEECSNRYHMPDFRQVGIVFALEEKETLVSNLI
jgi:hypothetical protein